VAGCVGLTSAALAHFRDMVSLSVLSVSGFRVEGPVLEHIQCLTNLTYLGLDSGVAMTFPDSEFTFLRNLSKLKTLALSLCARDENSSGFAIVSQLTSLQVLCMVHQFCDENSCKSLTELTELRKLVLFSPRLTDDAIKRCCTLSKLKSFSMGGDITDSGLLHLRNLNLERISVTSRTVTDLGIKYLGEQQPYLREIDLKCSPLISDTGLDNLAELGLQSICLQELPNITDDGIIGLRKISLLHQLEILRCTNVTRTGVVKLVEIHENEGIIVKFEDEVIGKEQISCKL